MALLVWLYRWEGRDLSRPKRALLVGLRVLTLLAVAIMLLEPVLVSTRRETVPSHLPIVVDDSESMRFSDPYTDNSRAVEIAASLKLQSEDGKVARGPAARDAAAGPGARRCSAAQLEALARGRTLFVVRPGVGGPARLRRIGAVAQARRHASRTAPSRRWATPCTACWRRTAASRSPGVILATDGRSNTGEDPLRAAEAAARQNIPIFSIAAGADEGPRNIRLAEIEVSPVVFARDPMTLGVVVEARGLKDAEATVVLEQRINEGDWEPVGNQRVVLGEDGILKRTTFRITPKVVGQYEYRAGSRTPARS